MSRHNGLEIRLYRDIFHRQPAFEHEKIIEAIIPTGYFFSIKQILHYFWRKISKTIRKCTYHSSSHQIIMRIMGTIRFSKYFTGYQVLGNELRSFCSSNQSQPIKIRREMRFHQMHTICDYFKLRRTTYGFGWAY